MSKFIFVKPVRDQLRWLHFYFLALLKEYTMSHWLRRKYIEKTNTNWRAKKACINTCFKLVTGYTHTGTHTHTKAVIYRQDHMRLQGFLLVPRAQSTIGDPIYWESWSSGLHAQMCQLAVSPALLNCTHCANYRPIVYKNAHVCTCLKFVLYHWAYTQELSGVLRKASVSTFFIPLQ